VEQCQTWRTRKERLATPSVHFLCNFLINKPQTALHKAALNGHLNVIEFLLGHLHTNRADVHAQDGDGWTALHNACSKGYLDIVRFLCEYGGAGEIINHENNVITQGVDRKSKGGWTPLSMPFSETSDHQSDLKSVNAASKGHLPVVLYLLMKQHANPLVRNNWGETAYDIAAAVFEVWICEVSIALSN
jgi:ankyrin repeat protein